MIKFFDEALSFGAENTAIKVIYRCCEMKGIGKSKIEDFDKVCAILAAIIKNNINHVAYKKLTNQTKERIIEAIAIKLVHHHDDDEIAGREHATWFTPKLFTNSSELSDKLKRTFQKINYVMALELLAIERTSYLSLCPNIVHQSVAVFLLIDTPRQNEPPNEAITSLGV